MRDSQNAKVVTGADIRQMLGLPPKCGVCSGTGKLRTYRGSKRYLPCHFCDGSGETKAGRP